MQRLILINLLLAIVVSFYAYSAGKLVVIPVGLATGAGEPKLGAGVGIGVGVITGVALTAAPAIFSCVRPKAAIPKTAPIAR
jgi:hypothetical protein